MNPHATSSAQDDFVVELETDDGFVGVGETDMNPWIARACVESPTTHTMARSLKEMLIGKDPSDIAGLVEELYVGSAHSGRRGAVISAIGAIEVALHDLNGKIQGVPAWDLLADTSATTVAPYASLQPEPVRPGFDAYVEELVLWAERAKADGFRAVKLEATFTGPYAHMGLEASDADTVELIRAARTAVGPDVAVMVDLQYAFMNDVGRCLSFLRACESLDLFFVEAPLWPDNLEGYRKLARTQATPIASGEWLATRHEFEDLIVRGEVSVAQPDIGRVGGLREAVAVARMAEERGILVVPHAWKTDLSVAAAAQFAAVVPNCPFIEYLPPELSASPLRKELADAHLSFSEGRLQLPDLPGLGVELNGVAVEKFEATAALAYGTV